MRELQASHLMGGIFRPMWRAVSTGGIRSSRYPVAYGLLAAAMLAPLLCATVPPLVDYPNHLARMWILVHRATVPELARNYIVQWRILPDLAMDLVVPALATIMSVVMAGRTFVALTMLGLVAGTAVLHRVLHRMYAIWPAWSVLFVYNAVLFWGFVSCLFAIAAYLFALSGWIATRGWRAVPRILVFAAVAALLFLLHVFAFGLYGLTVAAYELGLRFEFGRLRLRNLVSYPVICLQFIPGLLLWYESLANVRTAYTAYGGLSAKLYALLAPATFAVQPTVLDFGIWFGAGALLMFLVMRGGLKLVPQMRFPIGALILAAVLMPNWANGSWLADLRLPAVLPFVLIGSTEWTLSRKWVERGLSLTALVLFGLRVWTTSQSWHDYDRWFGEFRRASTVIVPGTRLLIVEAPIPVETQRLPGVPSLLAKLQPVLFWHMGALAVIDRSAFFPYLFTQAATVAMTPRNRAVSQTAAIPITPAELMKGADPEAAKSLDTRPDIFGQRPYWRDWPRTFDYVLWIDFSGKRKPQLEQLAPVATGSFFEIDKVLKR
ncbi:MAG TPA: hypothetical protein VJ770_20270 [Stellaceae bacterium]|nr:hypothetical protein [Stellaceae bacterium]